jgi:Alternate to MurJ
MYFQDNFVWVYILTTLIHFLGIVGLSARIVGIQTKKLASSFSLFNIITLIAQFSISIQSPLLAKSVESQIIKGNQPNDLEFRFIIFSATIGSFLGILAIPSAHRFMKKGVDTLYNHKSVFKVLLKAANKSIFIHFVQSLTIPKIENFTRLKRYHDIPTGIILLNILVNSFITVSVLSCLYAGYLNPNLRITALSLNGVSVGLGIVGMMLFVEPFNATLTDKTVDGSVSEAYFRRFLTFVVIARMIGTIIGQILLIPLAKIIIYIAEIL